MTEKNRFISRHSAHLYLLLNSGYISGLVLFGTHTLLEIGWIVASSFAVLTFFVYSFLVWFATILANRFFGDIRSSYKSAILVASLLTILVIPYTVLLSYMSIYPRTTPSKYYFYTLVAAGIVFATTLIYGYAFKQTTVKGKKGLEKKFTLWLELVKATLWIQVFFMLGTAYTQVLQGTFPGSDEMFLIFYGSVGFVVFVIAPLIKELADILNKLT